MDIFRKDDDGVDLFSFLPPLDIHFSGYLEEEPYNFSEIEENIATTTDIINITLPPQEMNTIFDPLCASLDIEPIPSYIHQDDHYTGACDEMWNNLVLDGELVNTDYQADDYNKKQNTCNLELIRASKSLSKDSIKKYFCKPIQEAANALGVGVTLLKKRCREVGIRRWPHRKLMSLETLIKNVQEMGREGEESLEKVREVIKLLEEEKKLIVEEPNGELNDKIKRLRQSCFKANYKKRKFNVNPT